MGLTILPTQPAARQRILLRNLSSGGAAPASASTPVYFFSVVLTKVTDGLVARAVVPRLRRLHGRPLRYEHSLDVLPFKDFERRVGREVLDE
jgi:hypothetical protein